MFQLNKLATSYIFQDLIPRNVRSNSDSYFKLFKNASFQFFLNNRPSINNADYLRFGCGTVFFYDQVNRLVCLVRLLHEGKFSVDIPVSAKQGYILVPLLFNITLNAVMRRDNSSPRGTRLDLMSTLEDKDLFTVAHPARHDSKAPKSNERGFILPIKITVIESTSSTISVALLTQLVAPN